MLARPVRRALQFVASRGNPAPWGAAEPAAPSLAGGTQPLPAKYRSRQSPAGSGLSRWAAGELPLGAGAAREDASTGQRRRSPGRGGGGVGSGPAALGPDGAGPRSPSCAGPAAPATAPRPAALSAAARPVQRRPSLLLLLPRPALPLAPLLPKGQWRRDAESRAGTGAPGPLRPSPVSSPRPLTGLSRGGRRSMPATSR